jgi:hypothetical protein
MARFTVHMPPDQAGDAAAVSARFVPLSRPLLALLAPPLFLALRGLWFWLAFYALYVALCLSLVATHFAPASLPLLLLGNLLLYLEGNELVRDRLDRSGWRLAGIVSGGNAREAEFAFFAAEARPMTAAPVATLPQRPTGAVVAQPMRPAAGGIGIFDA